MTEPTQKRTCRHGGFWGAIILLIVGLVCSMLLNAGLAMGLAARDTGRQFAIAGERAADEHPEFQEEWSYGSGDTKVVRIALDGIIMRTPVGGGLFGDDSNVVESVLQQIRCAENDEDVQAIVIEINSPGGAVTPSDEIHRALRRFRNSRADRRILAYVRDLCASGGYYIAIAADHIVSEPTAIVGSIGVIMESLNWHQLAEKIGVDATTIKSGPNKDLLNPFRPVNPENVAILQALVDSSYDRFLSLVAEGRKMSKDALRPLADGRVMSPEDAQKSGLIDSVGSWEDALVQTARLLEVEEVRVVRYKDGRSFFDKLFAVRTPVHPLARVADQLPGTHTGLMYLWRP
ncbi:MAG: signal peptide peptidase SppA [Kiritimatiellae bacterium]|nr:signal peptide peptidase SppA [Kiritimatiellia bacterium]